MPKRNTEVSSRESVPLFSLGRRTVMVRPVSMKMPRPTSTMPSTMVSHGRRSATRLSTGSSRMPSTPNTTTKPAVITAPTFSARTTARPVSRSSACSAPSSPRKYDR